MLYARINRETDEVLEFPISETTLRNRLVNTLLPTRITQISLAGTDYVLVEPSPVDDTIKPTADFYVAPIAAVKDESGKWFRQYGLVEIEADRRQGRIDRRWRWVRGERDRLMNETEWRISRALREQRLGLTPTDNISLLDSYMQQLADITEGVQDPFTIDPNKIG